MKLTMLINRQHLFTSFSLIHNFLILIEYVDAQLSSGIFTFTISIINSVSWNIQLIPDLPNVQDVECLLLFQALCGVMVDIPTLTGDKIPLNLANEVIKPTTVKRIPGET